MPKHFKGNLFLLLCVISSSTVSHNGFAMQAENSRIRISQKQIDPSLVSQSRTEIIPHDFDHHFPGNTVTVKELSADIQARSKHLQKEGLNALRKEDFNGAERLLEEALKLTPSDWTIYNNIGVDRACMKEIDKAAVWFERGLALAPHEILIAGNLGLMRWLQGRIEEGYSMLENAISLGYSPPIAHYAMGIMSLRMGLPSRAAKHLSRVKDGEFPYRDLFLSLALLAQGKAIAAAKWYRRFFKLNPVQYDSTNMSRIDDIPPTSSSTK